MSNANDLAMRIIHEQEVIIGPLAWSVAGEVKGLTVRSHTHVVLSGSGSVVLAGLVKRYEKLFGPASREVCRDAVRSLVASTPAQDVPDVLK
ncbi:MAG: hypothetical protein AAB663_00250 [Patescibacteria group bacterium]